MKTNLKTWLPASIAFVLISCGANAFAQEIGEVAFANSGAPAAQEDFLRGLAQLHNFEYDSAAEYFRKAELLQADFAMAFWGEAMTHNHAVWHEQELDAARQVLAHLGATPEARLAKAPTEREKLYLHSVEILYGDGTKEERDKKYELAMADLHKRFPGDVDATSFYALAILGSAENGRDFATYMRAAAVLEEGPSPRANILMPRSLSITVIRSRPFTAVILPARAQQQRAWRATGSVNSHGPKSTTTAIPRRLNACSFSPNSCMPY